MTDRINLFQPAIRKNPYPTYALLRREAPIQQVDPGGLWAVFRHEDIQFVYKHPELFSSEGLRALRTPAWLPRNPIADSLLVKDGPAHAKLRALMSHAFAPSNLIGLKVRVRAIAEELAAQMEKCGDVDFVDAFAAQLPGRVIAEIFGLSPSRYPDLKRWANDVVVASGSLPVTAEMIASVRKTFEEMDGYLREIIAACRQAPNDGMVTHLIRAKIDGQTLSDDEIVSFLFLLLPAGLETTAHALSYAMLHFTEHPESFEQLRLAPSSIPDFMNEVLRHTPPVQATMRIALADTEIGGVKVPKGAVLMLLIGSGNRDERKYSDPDQFDKNRDSQGGLAFGHGVHYCLGAFLAKLELCVGIEVLASRFSGFTPLCSELTWNTALSVRGPTSFPIRCIPLR